MRTSILVQLTRALCLGMLMNIATAAEQDFTIQDVENCRSETVEFQNAAVDYYKENATTCSGDNKSECLAQYQAFVNEIKAQDSVAFFWEGNESCEGSGYTCFGKGTLEYYSVEESREQLKAPPIGSMLISENDGYPSLNSNKVDRCIFKSRLARVDNSKQPNGPEQAEPSATDDDLEGLAKQTGTSKQSNNGVAGANTSCATTPEESFRQFDREMAMFSQQYPNQTDRGGASGARDQYQYSLFYGTNGLKTLERFRTCMSEKDYAANKKALENMRDFGQTNCEKLSTSTGSCTSTYPTGW